MDLGLLLVAMFSFPFAVTMGALCEICEFTLDAVFATASQPRDLPDTLILPAKPCRGSGLRDKMSDLIVDSMGALGTSNMGYVLYREGKMKTLKMMQGVFQGEKRQARRGTS